MKITIFEPSSLEPKYVEIPYDTNVLREDLRKILLEKYDVLAYTPDEITENENNDNFKYDVILLPFVFHPDNYSIVRCGILTKIGRKTRKLCSFEWNEDVKQWRLIDETNELKKFLLLRDY